MSSFDSITRALGLGERRREGEGVTGHRDIGVGHYSVCYAQHDFDKVGELRPMTHSSANLLYGSTKSGTCRKELLQGWGSMTENGSIDLS